MFSTALAEPLTRYRLTLPVARPILALGADTASRPALAHGDLCHLATLCGDNRDAAGYERFAGTVERLNDLYDPRPSHLAHDLHPNYVSTAFARAQQDVTLHPVQHHEAHVASAFTCFSLVGDVIGVSFDGTGYGHDGAIWGGEIFVGNPERFRRAAHLQYIPMPGGESAIRSPWKMAVSYVMEALGTGFNKADVPHFVYISEDDIAETAAVRAAPELSPPTSSAGRLFDAVAVLCGLFADAAVALPPRLEAMADRSVHEPYDCGVEIADDGLLIRTDSIVRAVVEDIRGNTPVGTVAARFHNTLAKATARACRLLAEEAGIRTVVLTGGVFYNRLLVDRLTGYLDAYGLVSYVLPPPLTGDEGIALGQAAIVAERIA